MFLFFCLFRTVCRSNCANQCLKTSGFPKLVWVRENYREVLTLRFFLIRPYAQIGPRRGKRGKGKRHKRHEGQRKRQAAKARGKSATHKRHEGQKKRQAATARGKSATRAQREVTRAQQEATRQPHHHPPHDKGKLQQGHNERQEDTPPHPRHK